MKCTFDLSALHFPQDWRPNVCFKIPQILYIPVLPVSEIEMGSCVRQTRVAIVWFLTFNYVLLLLNIHAYLLNKSIKKR